MRPVRSHVFRGKRYRIVWRTMKHYAGLCDDRAEPDKTIAINPKQSPTDTLDTIIHESLHACLPDIEEDAINDTATDVAKLLVRLGYRRG